MKNSPVARLDFSPSYIDYCAGAQIKYAPFLVSPGHPHRQYAIALMVLLLIRYLSVPYIRYDPGA